MSRIDFTPIQFTVITKLFNTKSTEQIPPLLYILVPTGDPSPKIEYTNQSTLKFTVSSSAELV